MRIVKNDKKYLNVCPLPMKLLLKTINMMYGDKMISSKDNIALRTQNLTSFIYDTFINKYGLLNVAERKLKEIFISSVNFRQKSLKIELFCRFLGLGEPKYTPDDLNFMFTIALRLLQSVSNATYVKREGAVFELMKDLNPELCAEIIEEFLYGKQKTDMLDSLRNNTKKTEVDADWLYVTMIEKYRKTKQEIIEHLNPDTDYYSLKQFIEVAMKKVHWNDPENLEDFFDKWSTLVKKEGSNETEKKISVETVVEHIYRFQMNVTTPKIN